MLSARKRAEGKHREVLEACRRFAQRRVHRVPNGSPFCTLPARSVEAYRKPPCSLRRFLEQHFELAYLPIIKLRIAGLS